MKLIDISHGQSVDLKLKKVVHILAIMFKHRKPRYQYSTCPSLNVDSEGGVLFWDIFTVKKISH